MRDEARPVSVFINCPFDPAFRPLFDGIVFTAMFCGFTVRSALEVSDSGELRLNKILRLIEHCRFSIHDISRVELDGDSRLPRFNMPIELGIALGMKHLGRASLRDHLLLVLDRDRYRYQSFASDLAGVDIADHGGLIERLVGAVRAFLAPHASKQLPGSKAILDSHESFTGDLPAIAAAARQEPDDLTFSDRVRHVTAFLEALT